MTQTPTSPTPSDEDLAQDALEGDAAAFRLLIERYHDPLMRFLFRLMGNRTSAEDVFQDTFLQIHQSLHTFDFTKRLKPWLFTIAANKGRDMLRRLDRRSAASLSASFDEDRPGTFGDLLSLDVPEVGTELERAETSQRVQQAIGTLSPRLREVLLLAYFQKASYQHIAEHLGVPIGTVKSRLHAAVASFAKAWQEASGQGEADGGLQRGGTAGQGG